MIIFDLLPYIFLLFLTIIIPKMSKKYMLLLFFVFFVFSGFRYGVGWDYYNYLESIINGGWMVERMEFLPRQLLLFCSNNGLTQTFYIVTSFLVVLCCFYMINKESINPAVSLFVFLCVPLFFLNSMTTIRFSLAVFIVFLAYHYGYEKKYLLFVLLFLIAFLFHKAVLFGLLAIPLVLTKTKLNFSTNLILFVFCFVAGVILGSFSVIQNVFFTLSNTPFFGDIFSDAENYMFDKGGVGYSRTPYVFALVNLINLISMNKLAIENNDNQLRHYVTMFNIGCSLMFLFSFNAVFASRFSQFFMVFLMLIVPFYKKNSIQQITLFSIFIFMFFFQLTIRAYNPDFIGRLNCWLPYRMNFSF